MHETLSSVGVTNSRQELRKIKRKEGRKMRKREKEIALVKGERRLTGLSL